VRSYFPGYTGHRPRIQHWHGTADMTLNYKNMAEDIKEWTNLLALSEAPTATDTPKSGTTHQLWKNGCGYTVYETFSLAGVGHAVPFDGKAVAAYFGLDKPDGQDPETTACPGAFPGGGATTGTGGATGSGGGGMSGSGATMGAGGDRPSGGGGAVAAGGGTAMGGSTMVGGASSGTSGTPGSGGGPAGAGASGGVNGTPGPQGAGGPNAVLGASGAGGAPAGVATGGSTATDTPSSGCGCAIGRDATAGAKATTLIVVALGLLRGHPRRRARSGSARRRKLGLPPVAP
jgi:acetylxylan esterase